MEALKQPFHGRLYLILQRLRGKPLKQFLEQLEQWERLPANEFAELHEQRLRSMLTYAGRHVPLYRTGPWKAALADGCEDLAAWPVLESSVLRTRSRELRAQPRPPRIVRRRTSGTSSKPLTLAFTQHGDTWNWAHRYRGMLWHGIPPGTRTLRLSADRRPLRDLVLGHYNVPELRTPRSIEQATRFLLDRRPPLVMGSPSALFYLARCLRERGIATPPAPVARSGGEQLFGFQRAAIEQHLGARVVDSYGCTEIGAIAGECPDGSMHIYADHVHLEIFDGDAPAPPGTLGDIVLTAMHNPAMPLIRYRVGDRGRLAPTKCRCGLQHPVLVDLQARTDLFRASDGSRRHASELLERLTPFFADPVADRVRQVQVAQVDSSVWHVLVEVPGSGGSPVPAAMHGVLAGIVEQAYGAECRVATQLVDAIPRHRGKLRYFRTDQP